MHGNVWEWTQTAGGGNRVSRGGSFFTSADYCTAGDRSRLAPDYWYGNLGFRLAASGGTAAK